MKDESTATSLQEAKEDAATHGSLLQQVTTVTLPDDDNFDLEAELSTLKCSSIEEWPNCPPLQEPTQNPDGPPFEAFVTQLHRILYHLQDAHNLPPVHEDFDECFADWTSHLDDSKDCRVHSRDSQRRMLQGMMHYCSCSPFDAPRTPNQKRTESVATPQPSQR